MFRNLDLKPLRRQLLLMLILLGMGASMLFWMTSSLTQAEQARQRAATLQSQASARLAQVEEEEREIRQYLKQYNQWDARLAFTEFNRAWVADETDRVIRGISDTSIRYKIAARTEYSGPETSTSAGYQLFYYPIEIKGQLLHEELFLSLYDKLNRVWDGPVNWERCDLKRVSSRPRRALPYIEFECQLKWLQLQKSSSSAPAVAGAAPGVPPL
ncbi:MAG: hypothetical protein ACK52D_09905 [Burkholderiales bacterium]